mmetsp:Transcript_14718/g.18552  ORF Transcript_14718/g.18552 Transcript_14718/m.18552 type:complete len:87 (+) Transcript_14718:508-768(+)
MMERLRLSTLTQKMPLSSNFSAMKDKVARTILFEDVGRARDAHKNDDLQRKEAPSRRFKEGMSFLFSSFVVRDDLEFPCHDNFPHF